MRLIGRRDASLAVALIAGTMITFERPFRWLLDFVQDLQERHHLDLLPALTLLTVVFVFQQYSKRLQAKSELAAMAGEVEHARARTAELERLIALGRSLANALDRSALEQALWRVLPAFIGQRECSILSRQPSGIQFLLCDARMLERHSSEALEELASNPGARGIEAAARDGVEVHGDIFIPMIAGNVAVGAVIVRNEPILSAQERLALGSAAAFIAVAMRNERLLQDARQSGVKDALTGCVTRAHGLEVLDRELRRARRTARPLSLIMFDVDRFKQINDTNGHLQGDAVLATLGAHINQILRSTDVRCRYGGDEFMVILPDTPLLGAEHVAESIRRHISAMPEIGVHGSRITVSLGVTSALADEMDAVSVIARADEALYRAKRAGRNRWCATVSEATVNGTTILDLGRIKDDLPA